MHIVSTGPNDIDEMLFVLRAAFGRSDEAELVLALLEDPGTADGHSLIAVRRNVAVGYALLTPARVGNDDSAAQAAILAPIAVAPGAQRQGIGRALVETGVRRLKRQDTPALLVFGDPRYYGRFGFKPAAPLGLMPPHRLAEDMAHGWQVLPLTDAPLPEGTVRCLEPLQEPHLWR